MSSNKLKIQKPDSQKNRLNVAKPTVSSGLKQDISKEQVEILDTVLNSLTHPFLIICANDYTITKYNNVASPDKLPPGTTCYQLTYGSDKPCSGKDHLCPIRHIKKTKMPVVVEHKHTDKDGNQKVFEVHGFPIFDDLGEVVEITEYMLDITERSVAEEKLKAKEIQSHAWLENSPVCTKILDTDFNLRYISSAGINGLKIDDISKFYGKPYPFDFYPESFNSKMTKNLERARETGNTITQEASVVDVDGNELWYHSTIIPVNDSNGKLDYIMVLSVETTERKQNEEKILQNHNELIEAQRIAHMGNWEVDLKTNIITASDEFYRIHDYEPQQIQFTRKMLRDNVHPEDQVHLDKIRESLLDKKPIEFEQRIYTGSGKLKHVLIRGETKTDSSGKPIRFLGTIMDITERKQIENLLKESDKRFKDVLHHSKDIVYRFNLQTGTYDYVSPSIEEACGITSEEYIKGGLELALTLIHPEDKERLQEHINNLLNKQLKSKIEPTVEYRFKHPDKGWQWFSDSRAVIFDDLGEAIGIVGCSRNIDKKRMDEEKIKNQQYYLSKAQEIGNIGTWELDLIKNILVWTEENYRIFGVPNGIELNYEIFLERIHPDDREYVNREWMAAIDGKPYDIEHRLIVDGKVEWVREKADLIYDDKGRPIKAIGFTQNISTQKHADEVLKTERYILQEVMNGAKNIHLVYLDRDFNFVRVNKTYADTCGYKPNEMVGKNHFDLYPHAENEAIFKKARETGNTYFVKDKPFSFPDKPELGVTYWDWSLCSVKGKQGDVDGLIFSLVETTERIKAEKKVLKSESSLKEAQHIAKIGNWGWDFHSNKIQWSDEMFVIYGFDSGTIPDIEEIRSRIIPKDLPAFNTATQKLQNDVDYNRIEYRFKRPDNKIICLSASAKAKTNNAGQVVRLAGTLQDITERKQNEEEILNLVNELQNSIDNMPNAYILWDLDLKILEWNKAAESIFGYTKEEMIGKNAVDFIVPEDVRHLVGDVLKKLQVGQVADYSEKDNNIRKDGSYISCQWHNTPLVDTDGNIYAILTLAQDITNRKKATEKLAESEKLLKKAQQIADMGSWTWNLKTNDVTWSDNLCRMHELEPDEFDGQFETVMSLTYPDDLSYVQENIEKLLASKQPFDFEYRIVTKTGKVKYVIGSQDFVLDNEGNIDFITGVLQDITRSKEAEKELQEAHAQLVTEQVALRSKNIALKEIMSQMGDEKRQMALIMQSNVDRTILPILNRLEEKVGSTEKDYIRLMENSLFDITSPFISELEKKFTALTSREIEISNMIKVGLSSKDIANALNISDQTVIKHRKSIRKKLGIGGHKVNLASHLKSLPNS